MFGDMDAGYDRVNGICDGINDYGECESGVSDALTSGFDTVAQRAGVCRDFSHFAIPFVGRSAFLPATSAPTSSKIEPPKSHAVAGTIRPRQNRAHERPAIRASSAAARGGLWWISRAR
jgi:transglutaminase-like putative cysteine protease